MTAHVVNELWLLSSPWRAPLRRGSAPSTAPEPPSEDAVSLSRPTRQSHALASRSGRRHEDSQCDERGRRQPDLAGRDLSPWGAIRGSAMSNTQADALRDSCRHPLTLERSR
jgi:hypothetical protein